MPSIISSVSFTTKFRFDISPKQFLFTDTTDYATPAIPLTGVKGVFKIVSPSGITIYNNTNFAAADIIANVSLSNGTLITLPLMADGTVEKGIYTITYSVQITDGTNPVYIVTKVNTYNNQYTSPTVEITQTIDCVSPLFTSIDATNYNVNTVVPTIVRTHKLFYPSSVSTTPITSAGAQIATATFYTGTQTTTISSTLTYTFTDGLILSDIVTGSKEIKVECDNFLCDIFCCLKTLYNNKEANRGVNDVLFQQYQKQFNEVMAITELAIIAIDCGQNADVETYKDKALLIANCDTSCNCGSPVPTLVTGLAGTGVNVVVDSCGTPIIVTSNTVAGVTTYTVCLDPTIVTKINNSYNTVVVAGSNISVVDSGIIASTRTFTVSATLPTPQNRSEFRSTIAYSNFTSPTVLITNSNYLTSGSNMNPAAVVESVGFVSDPNWVNKNNLFQVSDFQVADNNNYKAVIETVAMGYNSVVGTTLVASYAAADLVDLSKLYEVEVLNQGSGTFFFRFVDQNKDPISNRKMTAFPSIIVNIKISE